MVTHTTKYTLTTFDVEHNHDLDKVEYKNLSKAERKVTYNEQLFIIKAANANIVHVTQTEFNNFTHGVSCFIGDSNAQMHITRMEERQKFTKDFSFYYFVEDSELCGLLKREKIEAYGWLLRAFKKSFIRAPNIVVTDQDGSIRLAIAAAFPESKHRLLHVAYHAEDPI
ncbi:FAR1-related sequence 5-like protein [Tanacetum coccineum]